MTVHVCPERDIECGSNPSNWCATCRKRMTDDVKIPPEDQAIDLLQRMLEAPTTHIRASWKEAIRPVLLALILNKPNLPESQASTPEN